MQRATMDMTMDAVTANIRRLSILLAFVLPAWCDHDAELRNDYLAEARSACAVRQARINANPYATTEAKNRAWDKCVGDHLREMGQ
jgi:hypothetical protein